VSARSDAVRTFEQAFELLFSRAAARHAYDELARGGAIAGAVQRGRGARLWRAWRTAREAIENGRPLEGFEALRATTKRFPFDSQASDIAEAERLALVAECCTLGNQILPAIEYGESARSIARRFIERLETDRGTCAGELGEMLEQLASIELGDGTDRDALVAAWATTRGLDLTLELARRIAGLRRQAGDDSVETQAESELRADVERLQRAAGVRLGARGSMAIELALGDVYTESDPKQAFAHFDAVASALGVEDGAGLQAAINAANCLMRAGELAEAEARYASLESLFEMRGDYAGAARVWMSECIANWKRLRDPSVRHALVGAIRMFEEAMPRGSDPATRYTQKRLVDPGYALLITANAHSADRSDARIDETLSAVWAVLSRDLLANLEPEASADPWEAALARQRRPLAAMKTALAPLPALGVVHLISGIDCLVWIVYGYDRQGTFRFACVPGSAAHAGRVTGFLRVMHEHVAADTSGDVLGMQGLERELERFGEAIADDLPAEWRDVLGAMERVIYLPHPFGNVDELPLSGLRIGGRWLGERLQITRSPSVNHLREMLSPNRATVRPNRAAKVLVGSLTLGDEALASTRDATTLASGALGALGFEAAIDEGAGRVELTHWLDGAAGALHYVGHGIANEVMEALPLATGELFGPLDADRLDGNRVPFVFCCACVAARVRSGAGGYQTGVVSKLIERGAPAAIAFSMPVVESRAYALARRFYREASRLPFGDAARATMADAEMPAYVRLSMTAYGDPAFVITSVARGEQVTTIQDELASWDAALRNHCVLRTAETEARVRATLDAVPPELARPLGRWLDAAFQEPAASIPEELDALEQAALAAEETGDATRLSVRAAVCAERLHASGVDGAPMSLCDPAAAPRLLECANFLMMLGGALFDSRLNGLGHSLRGRVVTIDRNDATPVAVSLREGRKQLLECEGLSPFVRGLRELDGRLLEHYGHPA
jgi:hypothetical protein